MSGEARAQAALAELSEVILDLLRHSKDGSGNSDIARALGLESDFEGSQRNYLTWSIIGLLVKRGLVRYEKRGARKIYFAT